MAQIHDTDSQLPSLEYLWSSVLNSDAALNEVSQTFDPTTDAVSQNPSTTFNLSYSLASYSSLGVGGYQQANISGGVPYDIISTNAHHLTNRYSYGNTGNTQHYPRLIIPNSHYAHEWPSREYDPLEETDTATRVARDPLNGLDITNHADSSFFTGNTLNRLGLHRDCSLSADVSSKDVFGDFYENNSSLIPIDHVNVSTLDIRSNSALKPSLLLSDDSSSQTRFACHHPQCGGRTFCRRADRDRHARVHDNIRPYTCPKANCEKKFYRKDKLQSHIERGH